MLFDVLKMMTSDIFPRDSRYHIGLLLGSIFQRFPVNASSRQEILVLKGELAEVRIDAKFDDFMVATNVCEGADLKIGNDLPLSIHRSYYEVFIVHPFSSCILCC